MGGSPALYLEQWSDILQYLDNNIIFHSDFLLIEKVYKQAWLENINSKNSLYAVNIKGVTPEDFYINTKRKLNKKLFWGNFDKLIKSEINFYITFTNPDVKSLDNFKDVLIKRYGKGILEDSFVIDLIQYDALEE
jgi:hypothetical protein